MFLYYSYSGACVVESCLITSACDHKFSNIEEKGGTVDSLLEDKPIIEKKHGRSMRSVRPRGVDRFKGPRKITFRGAALCGSGATGELTLGHNCYNKREESKSVMK